MRRARKLLGSSAWASLALALVACQNDLPKATSITHMRVLGSKVQVVGDETRATPAPGEQVQVSFLTVFPKSSQTSAQVKSLLIGCTAPTRFTGGIPLCQELVDAAMGNGQVDLASVLPLAKGRLHCSDLPLPFLQLGAVSLQCPSGDPLAQLVVPGDFAAAQMLLLGVICERGDPFVDASDPLLFGCEHDSGQTIRVNALVPVLHKGARANHNPSIDALSTRFDDGAWIAPPSVLPADGDCRASAEKDANKKAGQTLPERDPGNHVLDLSYDASARETIDGKTPEDLELTVYSTAGEMERRFTLFDGSDDGGKQHLLESSVEWAGPGVDAPIGSNGKLVRFFITLLDHRGGFDYATRALCLYGPPPLADGGAGH
jgi:hypothetical protein